MTAPNWILTTENNGAIPRHFRPLVIQDNDSGEIVCRLPDGPAMRLATRGNLLKAAPQLLAACRKSAERIEELCRMVNSYSEKLGLGKKVNADDWTDNAREAIQQATAIDTPNV